MGSTPVVIIIASAPDHYVKLNMLHVETAWMLSAVDQIQVVLKTVWSSLSCFLFSSSFSSSFSVILPPLHLYQSRVTQESPRLVCFIYFSLLLLFQTLFLLPWSQSISIPASVVESCRVALLAGDHDISLAIFSLLYYLRAS